MRHMLLAMWAIRLQRRARASLARAPCFDRDCPPPSRAHSTPKSRDARGDSNGLHPSQFNWRTVRRPLQQGLSARARERLKKSGAGVLETYCGATLCNPRGTATDKSEGLRTNARANEREMRGEGWSAAALCFVCPVPREQRPLFLARRPIAKARYKAFHPT